MALPVSTLYYASLTSPVATTGVRMELWQGGVKKAVLKPEKWSVTVTSGVARLLDVTLASFDDLIPDEVPVGTNRRYNTGTYGQGYYGDRKGTALKGLLLVAYTQVKVWHRISVNGGLTWAECPVGVFDVSAEDFSIGEQSDETVLITGHDARRALDKAGWVKPYKVPAGNAWTRACQLATSIRPGLQYYNANTIGFTEETERLWFGIGFDEMSPMAVIEELARLGGFRPFINAEGRLTAERVPSSVDPAWTFRDGEEGTVFAAGRGHDDESLINTVVVIGDSTKKGPIYAEATITTPGDNTRASVIGRRTLTINQSGVTSQSQAQNIADRTLRRERGLLETGTITGLVLPFLEEFEVVGLDVTDLDAADEYQLQGYRIEGGNDLVTEYTVNRRIS